MTLRQNTIQPVDRLAQVNDPSPEAFPRLKTLEYIRVLVSAMRTMSQAMVARDTASPFLLLQSPNGTVYRVTVADDGTLTTVNARG